MDGNDLTSGGDAMPVKESSKHYVIDGSSSLFDEVLENTRSGVRDVIVLSQVEYEELLREHMMKEHPL